MKLLPYEVWRDIKGYEGLYRVSARGRVKSLDMDIWYVSRQTQKQIHRISKGRILSNLSVADFYPHVVLCKNKNKKNALIHRLMAESFINNPETKPIVNHINGVKTDNTINNLEWVTPSENTLHAFRTGLCKSCENQKKAVSMANRRKLKNINSGVVYESVVSAAKSINIDPRRISERIKNGRIKYLIYINK